MSGESKFKGVYRCGKKWKSQIQINGIQHYIGIFDTQEEAAAEYNSVSKQAKARKLMVFEPSSSFEDGFQTNNNSSTKRSRGLQANNIEWERFEKSCLVTLSSIEEASNLKSYLDAKIRLGTITKVILSVQLSETNEHLSEADLQNLTNLIDEQIKSTKQIMDASTYK